MPEENPNGDNRQLRNFSCLGLLGYAAWRAFQGFQAADPTAAQQAYGVAGMMALSSVLLFAVWTLRLPKTPQPKKESQTVKRAEEESRSQHLPPEES